MEIRNSKEIARSVHKPLLAIDSESAEKAIASILTELEMGMSHEIGISMENIFKKYDKRFRAVCSKLKHSSGPYPGIEIDPCLFSKYINGEKKEENEKGGDQGIPVEGDATDEEK